MEPVLADDKVAAFARDGVVCLRSVLSEAEVAVAASAIGGVLARPGPLSQVASGADDPGVFVEDFCRWRDIPEIEQLARYSRVPALAAALMATPQVRFYHDHVLVKEGGTRQRTPWHQDQPYYNVDGRGVSAWITVDPVPEDGCLELVAGSHRELGAARRPSMIWALRFLLGRPWTTRCSRWCGRPESVRAAAVTIAVTGRL
jgi:ectoine hydroxylase-related dioxygenase (phytanoyl-CoA dioxygenase family)